MPTDRVHQALQQVLQTLRLISFQQHPRGANGETEVKRSKITGLQAITRKIQSPDSNLNHLSQQPCTFFFEVVLRHDVNV